MGKLWTYSKKCLLLFAVYFGMFLIVFYSKELSEGIRDGMNVAVNLVIPSMFLFMIFSNIIIASRLRHLIARPFRFLARHVFRIPDQDTAIVVLSLVGGYPVGAKLLGDAVRSGQMRPSAAERMLAYCVNCGPAFLISGIGAAVFGSLQIGVYLYLSQVAACLIVGYLASFRRENGRFCRWKAESPPRDTVRDFPSGAGLIVSAVNDAVRSLAVICGFVVAFSSLMPVLKSMMERTNPDFAYLVQGLFEVTSGCNNLMQYTLYDPILLAALFTAFGGICVHLQVCAMLKSTGIRMRRFFAFRPLYTLISVVIMKGALLLIPGVASCISYNRALPQKIVSVSPAATIFLILLAIMLLFFNGKSVRMKKESLTD